MLDTTAVNYLAIVTFIALALGFGVVTILLSYLVQDRDPHPEKISVYECGAEPIADARIPFPARYYVIAMLFVMFDVENVAFYPWAVVFKRIGLYGFVEMALFILFFIIGLVYAWKKGGLEWD